MLSVIRKNVIIQLCRYIGHLLNNVRKNEGQVFLFDSIPSIRR